MKKALVICALLLGFACIALASPSGVMAQTCAIAWWGDWTGAVPTNETDRTAQACNEVFLALFNNTPDCTGPCYVPGFNCEDTLLPEGCYGWGELIQGWHYIICNNEIVCDTGTWSKYSFSEAVPFDPTVYYYEGNWDVICGVDTDGDGIPDNVDNCSAAYNPLQEDADGDGIGAVCDNCPNNSNSGQDDYDQDGPGDACDNCPSIQNTNQEDTDEDSIGDACDNCPNNSNPTQEDTDADGLGDACDQCANDPYDDIDADGVCGDVDNCPSVPNGPNGGICIYGTLGDPCSLPGFNPMECGDSGYCSMDQEDLFPLGGNGIGDACDCEGNFDCDSDTDGTDASTFKADFGRSVIVHPCVAGDSCNGDFNCDGDVDGTDASLFKSDFGRSSLQNPCPACEIREWCDYVVSTSTSTTMPATTTTSTVPGITTTTLPITTSTVPGSTTTTLPITTTTVPGTTTTTTPAQCELIVSPSSEIVYTWEHIQFSTTLDGECNPPCYSWDVVSDIGSTIDNNGFYTAGGSAGIDTVEVRDNCNVDTFDSAVVEVVLFTTTIPPTTTTTAP